MRSRTVSHWQSCAKWLPEKSALNNFDEGKSISNPLICSTEVNRAKKYIAIDCEMVGVGDNGQESSLARVSLINFYGATELDEFVQQKERVLDWRTRWSGIRAKDMVKGKFTTFLSEQLCLIARKPSHLKRFRGE